MEESKRKSTDSGKREKEEKKRINPRQTYHLEPEYGLLNDPVGLICFEGKFHVFFQWNSHAKDHSSKEWGHFSSPDLLHWTWHASPLKPGQEYDLNGVYSGSSVCWDNKVYAYYTGNRKKDGIRTVRQCLAISEDGIQFTKAGPVLDSPAFVTSHFRDPRVIVKDGHLEMLIGAQNLEKKGMILDYLSEDGRKWDFSKVAGESREVSMIECPDLITLPQKDVLLYCRQNRDPISDECLDSISVYRLLDKNQETPLDLDQDWHLLDAGFDSFAAQSLQVPDGRVLVFSWMNRLEEEQEKLLAEAGNNIHCLTLPREISIRDGKLIQKPARELRRLFSKSALPADDSFFLKGRCWMAEIAVSNDPFNLNINNREIQLSWFPDESLFTLFRWDWANSQWEQKSVEIRSLKNLQIFMDTSSIEIFLNEGEAVLSARILPSAKDTGIRYDSIKVEDIRIYPAVMGRFKLNREFEREENEV